MDLKFHCGGIIKGLGFVIILLDGNNGFPRKGLEFSPERTGVCSGNDWSLFRRGLEFVSERTGTYPEGNRINL